MGPGQARANDEKRTLVDLALTTERSALIRSFFEMRWFVLRRTSAYVMEERGGGGGERSTRGRWATIR